MPNLIIDIGSTALKACWADGITLGKTFRYQGEKIMDFILSLTEKNRAAVMIISSVREISQRNVDILRKKCDNLVLMDSKHTEISSLYGIPEYISSDRAASIIAARFLFKGRPSTIFDIGTTLTVDFLDSEGNHTGGNVSPGCRTRFKALNRYSRSLPLVNFPGDIPEKGNSVVSSIESGVVSGIMFEIGGYISRYPGNTTVFTGGDANYFAKRMKNSIFVVCNLVLMGLALIADKYE